MRTRNVVFALGVALLVSGCQGTKPATTSQQSAPPAATPPPPVETSLGMLVKAERAEAVALQVRCIKSPADQMIGVIGPTAVKDPFSIVKRGDREVFEAKPGVEVFVVLGMVGVCEETEPASTGKEYLVLSFEGETKRTLNEDGEMAKFLAAGSGRLVARVDSHSSVVDNAASFRADALVLEAGDRGRRLAFEVPSGTTRLVWIDQKARYAIDPVTRRLPDEAAAQRGR